jgi:hypothetical protein
MWLRALAVGEGGEEHRMKAPMIVLSVLLSCVVAGCGSARQAQTEMANAPTANVAGTWTGFAGTGGVSVPVTLTLAQTDTAVTGNINVGGRPDFSGPVKGSVQGELLRLALPTTTLGQLRAQQDTITGVPFGGLPLTLRRVR